MSEHAVNTDNLMRMFEPEDLHPELIPYLQDGMLRHPLVYSVPHNDLENKMANYRLNQKKKQIAEAIERKDWAQFVWLYERPYRLDAVAVCDIHLDGKDFWELLGQCWIDSENIHQNFNEWSEMWSDERLGREMCMDDAEREALAALPNKITIWRGVNHPDGMLGLSWTTNEDKAKWFARRFRSNKNRPILVQVEIRKEDVLAHFLGRNEHEIVVFPENIKRFKKVKI